MDVCKRRTCVSVKQSSSPRATLRFLLKEDCLQSVMGASLLMLSCTMALLWTVPVQGRPSARPLTTAAVGGDKIVHAAETATETDRVEEEASTSMGEDDSATPSSKVNDDTSANWDTVVESPVGLESSATSDRYFFASSTAHVTADFAGISNWTNTSTVLASNPIYYTGDRANYTLSSLLDLEVNYTDPTTYNGSYDASFETDLSLSDDDDHSNNLTADIHFDNWPNSNYEESFRDSVNNSNLPTSYAHTASVDYNNELNNITNGINIQNESSGLFNDELDNLTESFIMKEDDTAGAGLLMDTHYLRNDTSPKSTSLKFKRGAHIPPAGVHNKVDVLTFQAKDSDVLQGNITQNPKPLDFNVRKRDTGNETENEERPIPSQVLQHNESASRRKVPSNLVHGFDRQEVSSIVNEDRTLKSDAVVVDMLQPPELFNNYSTLESSLTAENVFNGSENSSFDIEVSTKYNRGFVPDGQTEVGKQGESISLYNHEALEENFKNTLDSFNETKNQESKTINDPFSTNKDEADNFTLKAKASKDNGKNVHSSAPEHSKVTVPFVDGSFQIETPEELSLVDIPGGIHVTIQPDDICGNQTNGTESFHCHSLEFDIISAHSASNDTELDAAEIELETDGKRSYFDSRVESPDDRIKFQENGVEFDELHVSVLNVTHAAILDLNGDENYDNKSQIFSEQAPTNSLLKLTETNGFDSSYENETSPRNQPLNETFSSRRNHTFVLPNPDTLDVSNTETVSKKATNTVV